MSSKPQGATGQRSSWGIVVCVVMFMLFLFSLVLVYEESWRAYAYTRGTVTSITVQDPCVDGGTSKSGGDDDCRATWTEDGRVVTGTAHLTGEAADGPARPYQTNASVLGDEAYPRNTAVAHVAGLLAPWTLLLSTAVLAPYIVIYALQERRRNAIRRARKAERDARRAAG